MPYEYYLCRSTQFLGIYDVGYHFCIDLGVQWWFTAILIYH